MILEFIIKFPIVTFKFTDIKKETDSISSHFYLILDIAFSYLGIRKTLSFNVEILI